MNNHRLEKFPSIIYGTAWKQDATASLTQRAIQAGFRAIDTANQKKHYREDFVGDALAELAQIGIQRESLFLQSKYTYVDGQDHRLPYDPKDSYRNQVKASFAGTLRNLHTTYLDSYLLNGPSSAFGLQEEDWEVWSTLEELYQSGQAHRIGVSNVNLRQLEELTQHAKIKPMTVQNRCFAVRGWDQSVRNFCIENGIVYQGFSLLTANPQVVESPSVEEIAKNHGVTPEALVLRFATQIGIVPLSGTTQLDHMKQDLRIFDFELTGSEITRIASV